MSSEDPLHDQFAEELEASGRPPLGDLVDRSMAEGRRKRRRRTTTSAGLGIVGVLGVAAAVQFVPDVHHTATQKVGAGASPAPSPTTAAAAPTTATSPSPTKPPVRVVTPGTLDLGDGMSLTLTHDSVLSSDQGGSVGPLYTDNGNQSRNSIGLQQAGHLVSGLYIGDGSVASAVLTFDGQSYTGTVVTLAGHPGWCDVYAIVSSPPLSPSSPVSQLAHMQTRNWTVYDAEGHVLASTGGPTQ